MAKPKMSHWAQGAFWKGGDISLLQKIEDLGGVYSEGGKPGDALEIFKNNGCNVMRLRLFHSPSGEGPVLNDLEYTARLGARIKAAGFDLLLDFHYSDTWADPGKQWMPEAWKGLSHEELTGALFEYTRNAIAVCRKAGALPDMVQVGNEIRPGMVWDDGRVDGEFDTPDQWRRLGDLVKAGIRGVQAGAGDAGPIPIMIHIDCAGDRETTKRFFDRLLAQGVEFDIIGQSYYPWWQGTLDDVRANMAFMAGEYGKDIVIVETGFPFHPTGVRQGTTTQIEHPASPAGQKAFLEDLIKVVRQAPDGRGRGVLYWAPEWIPVEGWRRGFRSTALFDRNGEALPALAAFKE